MTVMKNYESVPKEAYESTCKLSAPNLSISNNRIPATDIVFNPADLLPTDDFIDEISTFTRFKRILCWLFKICLLFILSVNIVGLIIDPTPLVRVYDFLTRPNVNMDQEYPNPTFDSASTFEAPKYDDIDLKHFSAKLNMLKDDMNALKEKIDNIDKWRLNLEYELAKSNHKNVEEMGQYFMDIEQKIGEALSVYDADKIGMIDYALETAGGKVISTPETVPYPASISWDFGYFQLLTPSSASQVIQAGNLPGQCFAFHGNNGRIRIRLAEAIVITSVTLEHTPFKLLSDISSCPKNFSVMGIEKPEDNNGTELGQFTFTNETALQNFQINSTETSYQYVELFIIDNYGKDEYTCVYRFRVHGNADTS